MSNAAQPLSSPTPGSGKAFDFSAFISRAKELCTDPKGSWNKISGEQITSRDLYTSWILIGSAIPPICSFLGGQIFGFHIPFTEITWRPPFFSSIVSTLITYAIGVASIQIVAMVLAKLAPKFGGKDDQNATLRLVAYAWTPAWIAGILMIFPSVTMGMLSALVSLYGLYLLYTGIPVMTGVPAERRMPYFGLSVVSVIVISIVLGLIVAAMTPHMPVSDFTSSGGGFDPDKFRQGMEQLQKLVPQVPQ